jgi:hypothetical protein
MGRSKSPKAEPTDEWELLLPLFSWPEQRAYEELRPLVLFGGSVPERARETGTPERTMYRRIERFKTDGMLSLFATDPQEDFPVVDENGNLVGMRSRVRRSWPLPTPLRGTRASVS